MPKKISDMNPTGTVTGTELVPIVQDGENKLAALNDLVWPIGGIVAEQVAEDAGIAVDAKVSAEAARDAFKADVTSNLIHALLPGDVEADIGAELLDERGYRIQSWRNDGSSVVVPAASGSVADDGMLSLLSGDIRDTPFSLIAEDGRALPGGMNMQTGMLDARRQLAPIGEAVLTGISPNRSVELFVDQGVANIPVSLAGEDPDAVWQHGETISYRTTSPDTTGAVGRRMVFSVTKPFLLRGTADLSMTIVYGQSNSNGGQATTHTVSETPARRGRALMLSGGARLSLLLTDRLPFDRRASLCDLYEQTEYRSSTSRLGETPCSGFAYALTAALPVTETVITNSFGIGGASIAQLSRGTVPYQNILDGVHAANLMAKAAGLPRVVARRMLWVHGNADSGNTIAAYTAALLQLQADLTADIQAITGQSEEVVFYMPQLAAISILTDGLPTVSQSLLNLHIAQPQRFRVTGPMYQYGYGDSVHVNGPGTRQFSEDGGRKCALVEVNGAEETCLYATSAELSGTTLTVTFAGAEGDLVLDTSLVSNPGQYGFAITQTGGAPPTLSDFAVSGDDTLTCTLSAAPGSSPKLTIAINSLGAGGGPTTGPRACLRDTVMGQRSDATDCHNYACVQVIDITEA